MKALTVHAPWGWAIAHLGKSVENRGWAPPRALLGQRIAIHQGKKWDDLAWLTFREAGVPDPLRFIRPGNQPLGAIVCTAIVAGWYDQLDGSFCWNTSAGPGPAAIEHSPWFFGRIGWWLENVVALPAPIPCKGAQGLWEVPGPIAALLQQGKAP